MPKCSVCGEEVGRLIDGKCTYCLTQESSRDEKARMDEENDLGGLTQSTGEKQDFFEMFKGTAIPLPDLSDEGYVAKHAGCDVSSRAWKEDGKKLMNIIRKNKARVMAGEVDYGTAVRFLNVNKPGTDKRLLCKLGSMCMWEYVKEEL